MQQRSLLESVKDKQRGGGRAPVRQDDWHARLEADRGHPVVLEARQLVCTCGQEARGGMTT